MMQGPPVGPEELPANLVRKCARCNDFTGEMVSVVTTYQQQIGPGDMPFGPRQQLGRDYRFKCTRCGAEFRVPGGQTVLTLAGIAVMGLVVMIGGVAAGIWAAIPIGLLFGVPVGWGLYQRRKHPGMF
jgi:hypothetical protein